MNDIRSYHSRPELKQMLVEEIEIHRKADQIAKGTYGEGGNGDWKGCAVGCSIHSLNRRLGKTHRTNDHAAMASELGWPEWLVRLEDTLFEGLPVEDALVWPGKIADAVPVGVDLEPIKWKFCAYLCRENVERVESLAITGELKSKVIGAIRRVLSLHEIATETGIWDESAAELAVEAAWDAAWSAAELAKAAAELAKAAAELAKAARSAESTYQTYSQKLLELLREAA